MRGGGRGYGGEGRGTGKAVVDVGGAERIQDCRCARNLFVCFFEDVQRGKERGRDRRDRASGSGISGASGIVRVEGAVGIKTKGREREKREGS